jgi:hypothetical protein
VAGTWLPVLLAAGCSWLEVELVWWLKLVLKSLCIHVSFVLLYENMAGTCIVV